MMVDLEQRISRGSALLALAVLVIQNTSVIVLLNHTYREEAEPYSSSSVVLVTELLKLTICAFVAVCQSKRNLTRALTIRSDQGLLFIPSALYVVQNNLLFLGAKLLPSVVYAVCTQTKILATAFMSWFLLGTKISGVKYASLFFLGLGIFLVQQTEDGSSAVLREENLASEFIGMLAVFLASFTSGTAGILLEKIYKAKKSKTGKHEHSVTLSKIKNEDVNYTIWVRNVQLSLISLPFALLGVSFQSDWSTYQDLTRVDLAGFDKYVWGVVICQAAGGIVIAFVMKFANNLLKCLAVAISICLVAVYSVATGSLALSSSLIVGTSIVVASVYVFSTSSTISSPERSSLPR